MNGGIARQNGSCRDAGAFFGGSVRVPWYSLAVCASHQAKRVRITPHSFLCHLQLHSLQSVALRECLTLGVHSIIDGPAEVQVTAGTQHKQ